MTVQMAQRPIPGAGRLPGALATGVVIGWFTAVFLMARAGVFQQRSPLPLTYLQLAIFVPMLLFWLGYGTIRPFRDYILSLDLLFLISLQCWRVLGGAILVMWGYGLLPGGFALPMSILDMSVGVIAVYAVYALATNQPNWQATVWRMNIWGFIDFFITIGLALFGIALAFDPPAPGGVQATLVQLPLSLFPSFAIPFFSCVHFAVFAKLWQLRD